jgi:DNA mismatch repair protein MSH5
MACIGAIIDQMIRDRAIGNLENEGIAGINVRGIEVLAL